MASLTSHTGTDIGALIAHGIGRDVPVVLCGSRATGDATEASDYDLFVVLPAYLVPLYIQRLRRTATELGRSLGADVSLNPCPRFWLRRPHARLLVWKMCREGVVLRCPPGFRLPAPGPARVSARAAFSYAMSGLRFLVEDLDPRDLAHPPLRPAIRRAVRKAVLHLVQLELLKTGRYEPTLAGSLQALPDARRASLVPLAEAPEDPRSWLEARDLLLEHCRQPSLPWPLIRALNLQYALYTLLEERRLRLRALLLDQALPWMLDRSTMLLAKAVQPSGCVDADITAAAARALPHFLRPEEDIGWVRLRDLLERESRRAHLLVGL